MIAAELSAIALLETGTEELETFVEELDAGWEALDFATELLDFAVAEELCLCCGRAYCRCGGTLCIARTGLCVVFGCAGLHCGGVSGL